MNPLARLFAPPWMHAFGGRVDTSHFSGTREAPAIFSPTFAGMQGLWPTTGQDDPTAEQQRTALRGLFWRVIQIRADAVADAMTRSTVERMTRPDEFAEVERSHPWVTMLRMPHPTLSPWELWRWAQQMKDLGRGAFFIVERDGRGVPVVLHPVYPAFGEMRPVGNTAGGIDSYVFHRADGKPQRFAAEDVIWIRHTHPVSPYEAASLLQAAAYTLDTALYEAVYRRDTLKDGGMPSHILTTDQEITPEQADMGEARFLSKFRRGRLPVLGKGMNLSSVAFSPEDMAFVEAAGLTRTDILQISGVPEGMVSDKANRANADAARYSFSDLTVKPETISSCQQLTAQMRSAFRAAPVLVVRPPNVVPLDPEFELKRDASHLTTGQRSINELRERDGFGKVTGGEVYLVSSTVQPLDQVGAGA